MAQTDLWTVPPKGGVVPDPEANMRVWLERKDEALRQVNVERRGNGCTCDAPPWFSPPGEWPMKIMLAHEDGCGDPVDMSDPLARIAAKHRSPVGHIDERGVHAPGEDQLVGQARELLEEPKPLEGNGDQSAVE